MKKKSVTALIVSLTDKMKPLLINILPIGLLRGAKKRLISSSMSGLEEGAYAPFNRDAFPDGINLIGFIKGEIGLGQSCRLVADALEESGLPFTVYNYEQVSAMRHSDTAWEHKITDTTPYNVNLIHINPYEMPLAFLQLGQEVWDKRYNIAFWLWELEKFPPEWENSLKLADEIWTPSEFAGESVRKVTGKPVRVIPYPVNAPTDEKYGREYFKLPEDKFLFLCMYDCNSTMERKNPVGVIEAYKKAFPEEDAQVGLIVKVNNPQKSDLAALEKALAGYTNTYLIADVLKKTQVNSLIACADVYASLHRSEGFGLVLAEAMLLGTPCIATNWSSNTEFMDSRTACMVDYSFIRIERDCGPYKAGNRWADPDLDQAAGFMKRLYTDKDFYDDILENAKRHIAQLLSRENAADLVKRRIEEIYCQKE